MKSSQKGKGDSSGSRATRSYSLRSSHENVRVLRSRSGGNNNVSTEPELKSTPCKRKRASENSTGKNATPIKSGSPSVSEVKKGLPNSRGRKTPTKQEVSTVQHEVKNDPEESKSCRRYPLRSSVEGVAPSSKLKGESKDPAVPAVAPLQRCAKIRKSGTKTKGAQNNEFATVLKRLRYLLHRIRYEQSLIDAYSTEGWKGQSLEKIRPEKELERAKTEIMRRKLNIRDTFKNLDSMLSEGKLDKSLFDSEGEISSDDICCCKCGSKQETLRNDIILCDGICDRGFHQKCLNPPLRTEDIPPGDEGWLCPGCDCKVDCIDLVNEFQGSNLTIEDMWEKVFPEVATVANGAEQFDESNLPSDDSEDGDYNPANLDNEKENPEVDKENPGVGTSSGVLESQMQDADLGLPSEDSEDDEFDPEGPDSDVESQKDDSSSDKSDFTSDSDDFCAELLKSSARNEMTEQEDNVSEKERDLPDSTGDVDCPSSADMVSLSARRQVERLDYKKLYDEAYGSSSDSSNDEEWTGKSEGRKAEVHEDESDDADEDESDDADEDESDDADELPKSKITRNSAGAGGSMSNSNKSTTQNKHFAPAVSQRLREVYTVDPYPSRATKESLAQELGLTFHQVTKWFGSTRHYAKVSSNRGGRASRTRAAGTPDGSSSGRAALRKAAAPERINSSAASQDFDLRMEESAQEGTPVTSNQAVMEESAQQATPVTSTQAATLEKQSYVNQEISPLKVVFPEDATPSSSKLDAEGDAHATFLEMSRNGAAELGREENVHPPIVSNRNSPIISRFAASPNSQGRDGRSIPVQSPPMTDEARKKAVLRELRRRKLCR